MDEERMNMDVQDDCATLLACLMLMPHEMIAIRIDLVKCIAKGHGKIGGFIRDVQVQIKQRLLKSGGDMTCVHCKDT